MSAIFQVLLGTLLGIAKKVLISHGKEFFEWAFFKLGEYIVESTETKHDDAWLAKTKDLYYKKDK